MGYAFFRYHREAVARQPSLPVPVVRDPLAEMQAAYDAVRAENVVLRMKLAETEAMLADATAPTLGPVPQSPPDTQQERRHRR